MRFSHSPLRALIRNRALAAAAVSIATLALALAAIASGGVPVQHVDANDGAVWLVDNSLGQFGRFDYPISELNIAFGPPGSFQQAYALDVLQNGDTVVAVDRSRGALYAVDAEGGRITPPPVTLPPTPEVALGGPVAAILDATTGKLWASVVGGGAAASLTDLNPASPALVQLAGATALAVGQDGSVYIASSDALLMLPFQNGALGAPHRTALHAGLAKQLVLTAVGDEPVILDPTHERLVLPLLGQSTSIPGADSASPDALQQPGPDADSVAVATSSAVFSVPFNGRQPQTLASGVDGSPAQPVVLNGCTYAAWAGNPGQVAKSCQGKPAAPASLPGPALTAPVFRVNNGQILLNDTSDGATWSVNDTPALLLNQGDWQRLLQEEQHPTQNQTKSQPSTAVSNKPPTAVDEQFEARPGRTSVLHVLDGCSDPAGSVLSVAGVTPQSGSGFSLQIAPDLQTVSVTIDQNFVAAAHFQYTIIDSRGQSATASVTVQPSNTETPPHLRNGFTPQVRYLASGATASYQLLGEWRDDQSDALSLSDASAPQGTVTSTGDGIVTYSAPVVPADTPIVVSYHVTDGLSPPVVDQLHVVVLGRGDTTEHAPIALPDATAVIVGDPVVIAPLANDIPGADPLHPDARLTLAGPVGAPGGITVNTDPAAGKLTVTAQHPGVYSLTYQDAFGAAPIANGEILVQARASSGAAQPPVTTPATALLRGQNPTTVDVLGGDYDPGGGLLTVLSVSAPRGIEAAVQQGEWVRLVATAPNIAGQQVVTYQVTNGVTSPVTGQVTVNWLPSLPPAPPIAPLQHATVRAGDEVDVNVLANDSDPSGQLLTLDADHVSVSPAGIGAASVTNGVVRYAAPAARSVATVAQVTVSYIVGDTSGESTTGNVLIAVNPADPRYDAAPAPTEVDARVVAGTTVTVDIPTTGVDPDGDSVAVSGLTDPPLQGRILSVSSASITYEAYPLSAGTDSFGYQVENPSGLTAEARVRIAVTPPSATPPPVAVDESYTAAPGSTLLVNLLADDIVAAGDSVTVEPLSETNSPPPQGAQLLGTDSSDLSQLRVRAPSGAQPLVLTYGISDGVATPSLAQVTVRALPGYVQPPIVADSYPPAPSAGQSQITVNALDGDADASGDAAGVRIASVLASDVTVNGAKLVIPVHSAPRSVAYRVRASDGAEAVAVVHVAAPLLGPHLRANALIQVPRSGSASVAINDYIVSTRGPVSLVSSSDVFVSPANGLSQRPDTYSKLTLSGTGAYDGPGALTVTVTDGASPQDAHGRTATVSIPVQVGPPIPVLRCPATPVPLIQGGVAVTLRLATYCAVWAPEHAAIPTLAYTAQWSNQASGVRLGFGDSSHRTLVLTPGSDSTPGSTGAITVGVDGYDARAALNVAVTAAPPLTVSPITVPAAQTGRMVTVDVRQYSRSPLSGAHIQVASLSQTGGGNATTSFSGSAVDITPLTGTHGTLTFSLGVTDVPGRADRTVAAGITLQVLDVPGQPGALQGVPGNGQVALSWTASDPDGAPVDSYQLSIAGGGTMTVPGTAVTWPGLSNGVAYQFTVRAHNQVGLGPAATATFTPVSVPGAPGAVSANPGDAQVGLSWGAASSNGQAVDSYIITVNPAPASGSSVRTVSGGATSYVWTGLDNNVGPYTFSVAAHNGQGAGPSTQSPAVYAHGVPATPAAPSASGALSPDQSTTTITVSWPGVSRCNDAQPCTSYTVTEYRNGSAAATQTIDAACGGSAGGFCATFGPITNDSSAYTYAVQATNREGQSSAQSAQSSPAVNAVGTPGTITDLSLRDGNQQEQATFTLPASHGSGITRVGYTAVNQSNGAIQQQAWSTPGVSGQQVTETVPGLANGSTYSITVAACNSSECGQPSNAATGSPYGQPLPPAVSSSVNGDNITWSWSGGGNNGRPVTVICVRIDGGNCTQYGYNGTSGSVTDLYGCGQSHTMQAQVTDSTGHGSQSSQVTGQTTAPCGPSMNIGWSTTGHCPQPGSSTTQCWIYMQLINFGAPPYSFNYDCEFQPTSTSGPYPDYVTTTTIDDGKTCYVQGPGVSVRVHIISGTAAGVYSNWMTSP